MVVPIAIAMVFFGALFTAAAVALIVFGAAGARSDAQSGTPGTPATTPAGAAPPGTAAQPAVSSEGSTTPSG